MVFEVEGKGETHETPFYDRAALRAGDRIAGPAIVEQYDTTVVIPPRCEAEIDRRGNIVIDCAGAAAQHGHDLAAPIMQRVIGGAFTAIAQEMAGVLYRMSYSSIIRESEDLGAGIFDCDGLMLAESESTPMFMGAMPRIVQNVIELLPGDIHEGDIIFHNDPYYGATHSPDCAIVMPIYHRGRPGGVRGRVGPSARHRRRLSGAQYRRGRHLRRRQHLPRGEARGERGAPGRALGSTSWRTCARPRPTRATSRR